MALITVDELKAHLNITTDDDDALLEQYAEAAEGWIGIFTGLDLADPVPATLKQAARLLAGHWYETREAVAVAINAELIPFGVHDLCAAHRVWSF